MLGDNAVRVGLRVWCATGDYLRLSWALTEAVKLRFDALGVTMALPTATTAPPPAPPR
jgi:small conductance mechanosensitive channel